MSLIEMKTAPLPSASSGLAPISAPDPLMTFQASLVVAQNHSPVEGAADSASDVSSSGKDTGKSARSTSDDTKPQDVRAQLPLSSDALSKATAALTQVPPLVPAQQQTSWSAETAELTSAPVSTPVAGSFQVAQAPATTLPVTMAPGRALVDFSAAQSFYPGSVVPAQTSLSSHASVAAAASTSSGRQGKDTTPVVSRTSSGDTVLPTSTSSAAVATSILVPLSQPVLTQDVSSGPTKSAGSVPTSPAVLSAAPFSPALSMPAVATPSNTFVQNATVAPSASFAAYVSTNVASSVVLNEQQGIQPAVQSEDTSDSVSAPDEQAPQTPVVADTNLVSAVVKAVPAFDPATPLKVVSSTPTSSAPVQAAPHSIASANTGGVVHAAPLAPATDAASQATPDADVSNTVVSSFVSLIQPGLPPIAAQKTSNAPVSAKGNVTPIPTVHGQGTVASVADNSAKQTVHAANGAASSQADSQGDSQQNSQAQSSPVQHSQTVTPAPSTDATQPGVVANHAQVSTPTSTTQPSPTPQGAPAAVENQAAANYPAATLPHQVPEVNTAKLIQSVGQSEMRLGMRSSEFGDISIHTSTTRDIVSAQISLDHDELARTLVTHLPEIQAKLGGGQPFEVRIDMNGQTAGQQAGQQMGQGAAGGAGNNGAGDSSSSQSPRAQSGCTAVMNDPIHELRSAAERLHAASNSTNQRLDVTV